MGVVVGDECGSSRMARGCERESSSSKHTGPNSINDSDEPQDGSTEEPRIMLGSDEPMAQEDAKELA